MSPLIPTGPSETVEFNWQGFMIYCPFFDEGFELYFCGQDIVAVTEDSGRDPKNHFPEKLKPKRFKKL